MPRSFLSTRPAVVILLLLSLPTTLPRALRAQDTQAVAQDTGALPSAGTNSRGDATSNPSTASFAGGKEPVPSPPPAGTDDDRHDVLALSFSALGTSTPTFKNRDFADVQEFTASAEINAPPLTLGRFSTVAGASWQGVFFDRTLRGLPLPKSFHAVSLSLGVVYQYSKKWTFLLVTNPGVYSDLQTLRADDFNSPTIALASYAPNPHLTLSAGFVVTPDSNLPVFPMAGLRWRISERWKLDATFPRADLEYKASDRVTLHAGGNFVGTNFRVGSHVGRDAGDRRFDNAVADYQEVRATVGASVRLVGGLSLDVEGGYAFARELRYYRVKRSIDFDDAPVGRVALRYGF